MSVRQRAASPESSQDSSNMVEQNKKVRFHLEYVAALTMFDAWTREESIHTRSKTELKSINRLDQMASNTPFLLSFKTQSGNIVEN